MKTKFKIIIACFFIWSANSNSKSLPGEISGTVTDEKGETLLGASITYEKNGTLQGTVTDVNGTYHLKPLDAGKYDVTYSFVGHRKEIQKGVEVSSGQITFVSVKLSTDVTLPTHEVVYYKHLFEKDE